MPDGAWPTNLTVCVMDGTLILTDDAGFRGRGAWAGQALCQSCAAWLRLRDAYGVPAPWRTGEEGEL